MNEAPAAAPLSLHPLQFHRDLRDLARRLEPGLWHWLASTPAQEDEQKELRLDLLRNTVRLDETSHPELRELVESVRAALSLSAACHLYQAQGAPDPNAAVIYLPGEAHIVFSGPILTMLTPVELKALLAHELAHYLLLDQEDGTFRITERLMMISANHPAAANAHYENARLWRLYTEIFADRVALEVTADLEACVAMLVKVATGLTQVSGASYLKQAEEILSSGELRSEGLTHPELFIRARALDLWKSQGDAAEPQIGQWLRSNLTLDTLDWLQQSELTDLTRRFLAQFLRPSWIQTPACLAHAQLYFEDFAVATEDDDAITAEIITLPEPVREFFLWMLADFVAVERELEDLPLALALDWSRRLEMEPRFESILQKDLNLKIRDLKRIKRDTPQLLSTAGVKP